MQQTVHPFVLSDARYDFIGHEIASIFPDHNHAYSDWIRIYASDELIVPLLLLCERSVLPTSSTR